MERARRGNPESRLQQLDLLQGSLFVEEVAVERVQPARSQARGSIDPAGISELAESIRLNGLLSPILVRPIADAGRERALELVAGERRWRAVLELGWETVPARVLHLNDSEAAIVGLVENVDRENLTAWDEARAVAELRTNLAEAGRPASGADLARLCGWSEAKVSERLTIADALPPEAIVAADLDLHAVKTLPKSLLLNASRLLNLGDRLAFLARAVRRSEVGNPVTPPARRAAGRPVAPFSFRAPRSGRIAFELRRPIPELAPDDARALHDRLAPVLEELRRRMDG
jgi:ParB/RepB/Spo0J family partition protein